MGKTLDNKGYTRTVSMDLSKAFDTINYELLITELHGCGFSKDALKLIFSYSLIVGKELSLTNHLVLSPDFYKESHRNLF